jgi:hypothetical protein
MVAMARLVLLVGGVRARGWGRVFLMAIGEIKAKAWMWEWVS